MTFLQFIAGRELDITTVKPRHVRAYLDSIAEEKSVLTVKQHLAALRGLYDWLVVHTQTITANPAQSVRGPRYSADHGKTPALSGSQAAQLIDSIDLSTVVGLRDRALIGVMLFSLARVSAALGMNVGDFTQHGTQWRFRLREKRGKDRQLPAHHLAAEYLHAYIEAAGIADDRRGPLFRTAAVGQSAVLTSDRMSRVRALRVIKRRVKAADLPETTSCHAMRATGITLFLEAGGSLENAQLIAGHASPKTTRLYDRRGDKTTLEEIERIRLG